MPIRFETLRNTPGGAFYDRAVRRTAWPTRMGVTSAVLVAVLPLLLVVLAALVAGVAVYAVCSLLAGVGNFLGIGTSPTEHTQTSPQDPQDPMRENVRVVSRP